MALRIGEHDEQAWGLAATEFRSITPFFPYATDRITQAKKKKTRFVHYTSGEVAESILTNKTVWMRNSLVMNDWQEVDYGMACFAHLRQTETWSLFVDVIDQVHPGFMNEYCDFIDNKVGLLKYETYMTSLSEHLDEEDGLGRLSMWRAYGGNNGVALVVNQDPFMYVSHISNVNSCPVLYADRDGFVAQFARVVTGLESDLITLRSIDRSRLFDMLTTLYLYSVLGTKHPGFHEEREWRVLFMPWIKREHGLKSTRKFVGGLYQTIFEVPLVHNEDIGLHKADIPSLLNCLIIGPTQNPVVQFQAFCSLLSELEVPEPYKKVIVSNIPLRR